MKKLSRVVSVRGISRKKRDAFLADKDFLYVGRGSRPGWKASPWMNPFKPGMNRAQACAAWIKVLPGEVIPGVLINGQPIEREIDAVEWFAEYIQRSPLRRKIGTLRGKILGCWCCNWTPGETLALDFGETRFKCHAIYLASSANDRGQELSDRRAARKKP